MTTEATKAGPSPILYILTGVAVLILIGALVYRSTNSVNSADAAAATAAPPPAPNAVAIHPGEAKSARQAAAIKTVPGLIKRAN